MGYVILGITSPSASRGGRGQNATGLRLWSLMCKIYLRANEGKAFVIEDAALGNNTINK